MSEKKNRDNCVENVGCHVKDCLYHSESDRCHARQITVSNEMARQKAETFCSTFVNKMEL